MSSDEDKMSRLYREADRPAPPQALDDAILSAARTAVERPSQTGPFSGAWPAMASAAAVVIIAIILVPVLRQEQPEQKMEQDYADISATDASTEEELVEFDSVTETRKRSSGPPAEAAGLTAIPKPEANVAGTAMPGTPSMHGAAVEELPVSANVALPAMVDTDPFDRSRMEAADSAPFAVLTPEMWEVKITQLIDDGKIEKARAELDKMKAHFPAYDIDRAIVEKLRGHRE